MHWYFFGAAAGVVVVALIIFVVLRNKLRRFSRRNLGGLGVSELLRAVQSASAESETDAPRSLSGGDALIGRRILRDFPDFNLTRAKSLAAAALRQRLADKQGLKIHKLILHDYRRAANEKTIVFQAAVQYNEDGKAVQKRFCLHYDYLLPQDVGTTVAGSCPHCGAAFTDTAQTACPYCGSLVANVLGNTWQFTDFYEQ